MIGADGTVLWKGRGRKSKAARAAEAAAVMTMEAESGPDYQPLPQNPRPTF